MDTNKSVVDACKNLLSVTLNEAGDLDISVRTSSDEDLFMVISTLVTMSEVVYKMLSNEFGLEVAKSYIDAVKSYVDDFADSVQDKCTKVC